MFFFLPYRVKNPAKNFPYATLTLIVINVLIYMFTTQYYLEITKAAQKAGAFAFGESSPFCFISSIFLHGNLEHILGNMLFLWIFGPPVEDRLGIGKYLGLYFVTGFAGAFLEGVLDKAFLGHAVPVIGASGCIAGVIGAYWRIFPWSKVCVAYFYWFFLVIIRWGVWEIAAVWLLGYFFVKDLFWGLVFGSLGASSGVAMFVHVGATIAGFLICVMLNVKRDNEELSEAKAIQSDMKQIGLMPLHALEIMSEADPQNPEIIRAMVTPALNMGRIHVVHEAMKRAGAEMIDIDPGFVAHFLTNMSGDHTIYKPVHLLRLAGTLEKMEQAQLALAIYQIIVNAYPAQQDAETALYRMATCCWNQFKDRQKAERCLGEMLRRFPNGSMAQFGRNLQRQMAQG